MHKYITILILALSTLQLTANSRLLNSLGTYKFSGESYEVEIRITEVSKNHIKPLISFIEGQSTYGAGYGGDEGLPITPKKWTTQFQAPNKFWVFDGAELILLYERTSTGIKGYDNAAVRDLINSAPEEFKQFVLNAEAQQN